MALEGEVPHHSMRPRVNLRLPDGNWRGANALGAFAAISDVDQIRECGAKPRVDPLLRVWQEEVRRRLRHRPCSCG
eukprot:1947956-Pleurochrysis_carterae.AAC.1